MDDRKLLELEEAWETAKIECSQAAAALEDAEDRVEETRKLFAQALTGNSGFPPRRQFALWDGRIFEVNAIEWTIEVHGVRRHP